MVRVRNPGSRRSSGATRSSASTSAGPPWSKNGVTSIVNAATARNPWYMLSDISASPRPSFASTNENSPIWETRSAAKTATRPA